MATAGNVLAKEGPLAFWTGLRRRVEFPRRASETARRGTTIDDARRGIVKIGFGAYYMRCAPHATIILLSLDEVKKVYKKSFGITD
mgnify:CR=1 FL=1